MSEQLPNVDAAGPYHAMILATATLAVPRAQVRPTRRVAQSILSVSRRESAAPDGLDRASSP